MVSGRLESGASIGAVGVVVGIEMDVIDVKTTGLLVLGGRMNMARLGEDGAENQQEPQDH